MSKCPPGVICLSHGSLLVSLVLLMCVIYFTFPSATPTVSPGKRHPPTIIVTQAGYPGPMSNPSVPPLARDLPTYTQQGILKAKGGETIILPLMGHSIHRPRDKWTYFTYKDGSTLIKLPILYNKKNCMGEYGCDRLTTNDVVYVEGYDMPFEVVIYENDCHRYSAL